MNGLVIFPPKIKLAIKMIESFGRELVRADSPVEVYIYVLAHGL